MDPIDLVPTTPSIAQDLLRPQLNIENIPRSLVCNDPFEFQDALIDGLILNHL